MSAAWEPRVVVFLCQWSLHSEVDREAVGEVPANVRVVEVPCSGRVSPLFLLGALQDGADGVLVVGCAPEECHYKQGNFLARRRLALWRSLLAYVGVEEERVGFAWFGAADRRVFLPAVEAFVEQIRALGPAMRLVVQPDGAASRV